MIDLDKAQEKIKEYERFEKQVLNAALEEAAKVCDKYESYGAAYEIRTMKK